MGQFLLSIFCGGTPEQVDKPNGTLIGLTVFGLVSGWLRGIMDLLHWLHYQNSGR
jgi:hypothetical protein